MQWFELYSSHVNVSHRAFWDSVLEPVLFILFAIWVGQYYQKRVYFFIAMQMIPDTSVYGAK